jgi:hypothetical protein
MLLAAFLIALFLVDHSKQQGNNNENPECEEEFCDFHCSVIYYRCGNENYQKCSCENEEPTYIDYVLEFFKGLGVIFYKPAKPIRPLRPPNIAESSVVLATISSNSKQESRPANPTVTNNIPITTTTTTTEVPI